MEKSIEFVKDTMVDCPLVGRKISDGYCWELCNIGTNEILLNGDKVEDWNQAQAVCEKCEFYWGD